MPVLMVMGEAYESNVTWLISVLVEIGIEKIKL
jgi:hypothetical protein